MVAMSESLVEGSYHQMKMIITSGIPGFFRKSRNLTNGYKFSGIVGELPAS
jgi:hypothetical protein